METRKMASTLAGRRAARAAAAAAISLAVALLAAPAPDAAALSGSPIKIGSPGSGDQAAVAVDGSGTAYTAWDQSNRGLNTPDQVQYCVIPAGATACSHSGNLSLVGPSNLEAVNGVPDYGVQVLADGGTIVILADVANASSPDDMPLQEWQSTNGGASFTSVNGGASVAYDGNPGSSAQSAVILPGTGELGFGWAATQPLFTAFPLSSSPECSLAVTTCPFATLGSPADDPIFNHGYYASELSPTPGVLGVFETIGSSSGNFACPSAASGIGFVYGSGAQATGSNDYTISPGSAGSAWKTLHPGLIDCTVQYPAVAGGPAGFGMMEEVIGATSNQTVYRAFNASTMSWGQKVAIAQKDMIYPSLSQDGAGGIYATYLYNDGTLSLSYSGNGGATWAGPVALNPNTDGAANKVISSISTNGQGWLVWDDSGSVYAQQFVKTDALPVVKPPASTAPPTITGKPKAGKTLSCSRGTWSNSPTSFTYQWNDDGTPIAGATSSTYTVTTLEEGTALTCTVTATNAGGSARATSRSVKVPIPYVPRCPGATGKLSGATLGLVKLGATRAREHYLYRHHSDRGKQYEDFFCLTPIGVRVGYGSPKLLRILTTKQRRALRNKVVWASTSNPFYSIDGVRPGEAITIAAATLHTAPPLHIGRNHWYLAVQAHSTAVLKVRNGAVEEIGIADNLLSTTAKDQNVLMHSFY
jgi:hypothetical protein